MNPRITIACPVAHRDVCNALAGVLGYSEADAQTFTNAPIRQDVQGNQYCVVSGLVEPVFLVNAFGELVEPEWGADMQAAQQAQAMLRRGDPDEPETCLADPEHIVAVVHDDPDVAMALLGVHSG